MDDPEAYRAEARERWERSAPGWAAIREATAAAWAPVTTWLLDALDLQPGQTVLELAGGVGDVGLEAAERVGPSGRVILTDGAEAMVAVARERAEALGLAQVEAKAMEAEWIDLGAATVDAVACRWGYMLLVDPETSFRETRRVLRPEGRVALSAWAGAEHNPWLALPQRELARATGATAAPGAALGPGPFAFAPSGLLEDLLLNAGFEDVAVEALELELALPSLDAWWELMIASSPITADAVKALAPAEHYALRDAIDAAGAAYVDADGTVRLPARTLVAVADA